MTLTEREQREEHEDSDAAAKKIEAARYYELYDEDVVNFGKSNVEYVIMKGKPLSKSEKERQQGGSSNVAKGGVFGL